MEVGSKKWEVLEAMLALHFAHHYNYGATVRPPMTEGLP